MSISQLSKLNAEYSNPVNSMAAISGVARVSINDGTQDAYALLLETKRGHVLQLFVDIITQRSRLGVPP